MAIKVFSVNEMVAAEKAADAAGITYDQMMETAGTCVADAIAARYDVEALNVLVLVGPGNNGGDGLVAGRYLAEAGADVAFYLYHERDPETDVNFAQIQEMGLFAVVAEHDQRYRVLRTRLAITDLVIDALLGTGVSRPIGGELARLMRQVANGIEAREQQAADDAVLPLTSAADIIPADTPHVPVVAVDCPSGLRCDTGKLDPLTLTADLTVTFAGPKRGHFLFPGAAACGEIVVADINIPPDLDEVKSVQVELATASFARSLLPPRPLDGHKGTFGKVLVVAGSANYWGAPVLAARGAYRTGSGLVALCVPESIRATIAGQLPEATYVAVDDEDLLSGETAESILQDTDAYDAILVGPGLGEATEFMRTLLGVGAAGDFVQDLLARKQKERRLPPLVVDADGLNRLAETDDWPQRLPANSIITPHPGEMARLMGAPLGDVKIMNRIELAQEKAVEWGHVLVLKGAYTIVAAPDGRATVIPFANPALAIGGTGDVLAGVIVSLLGQGMGADEAAVLGCWVHGAAGELFGRRAGLLSHELADYVPDVLELLCG